MKFESILYETNEDRPEKTPDFPAFFVDLNLDQIIGAVVTDRQEYELEPVFWHPLKRISAITYRHEVMQELERPEIAQVIRVFAQKMHNMRTYLARSARLSRSYQGQRWFLDAVSVYCDAVTELCRELSATELTSKGFQGFLAYLKDYSGGEYFTDLAEETRLLEQDMDSINYCVQIKGKYFTIKESESEVDYSAEVEKTFARFNQGDAGDYLAKFSEPVEMNGLESTILRAVVELYPEQFESVLDFFEEYPDFLDRTIAAFDREIQFYMSYLDFITGMRKAGLQFCYPGISDTSKDIVQRDGFDLALANKLVFEERSVVCNDFSMSGRERICVISGPNQGGKTSFARSIGQSHYLASLGLPVPGIEAKLFHYDKLFTLFEMEENVEDRRSKLEDDLTRVHDIVSSATSNSLIIANEVMTSTTLQDSVYLGKKVMDSLGELDVLCVWVTFIDELVSYSDKAVSMISMVDAENPSLRTYKIVRKAPHGVSYTTTISEKYGLTYEALKERIK